jgi:vacuolar protein sorting-associated protein 35
MQCADVDTMYRMLLQIREYLGSLETIKLPVSHSVVPLVTKALKLIQTIYEARETDNQWEKKAKAVAKYVSTLITTTRGNNNSSNSIIVFNLYLQSALQTGKCGLTNYTYGFLTQGALTVFEDDNFPQSPHQYIAIRQLICTVEATDSIESDNYENLAKRIAQHASKLILPENQARATLAASHLFISNKSKETKNCVACLNKALSFCKTLEDPQLCTEILLEVLDTVISIYNKSSDVVDAKFVNATLQSVQVQLTEKQVDKGTAIAHFHNIKEFILYKQNWKNLIPQQMDGPPDFNPVTNSSKLSKSEAKSEAEKWRSIIA